MPGATWIESAEVQEAIDRLGPVLLELARPEHPRLAEMAVYLAALGGKRIRPALLFIAHGPGCTTPEVLRAAASVELIHLASLYHDDIIDRGRMRRGAASANAKWGNRAAMLTGTFLFLRAQALTEALGREVRSLAATAAAELCLGQLRESENAYDAELTAQVHLDVLALKTGSLFRLALQIGALLGGARAPQAQALADYGRHLGLAFQLSDDLLDLGDDAAATGKDALADIRAGVYSLPWLLALRGEPAPAEALKRLFAQHSLSAADVAEALAILRSTDAITRARERLGAEIQKCLEVLGPIQDTAARASLAALARSMATRTR